MNDLVKRLRKSKAVWSTSALGSLADEAADRIAYLESDDAIVDMMKKLLNQLPSNNLLKSTRYPFL